MQLLAMIEEVFQRPPIPFDPQRQTLKNWATFCLRDRGFKVVYAQNADFAIETRTGKKLSFKLSETSDNLDGEFFWLVRHPNSNTIQLVVPQ